MQVDAELIDEKWLDYLVVEQNALRQPGLLDLRPIFVELRI